MAEIISHQKRHKFCRQPARRDWILKVLLLVLATHYANGEEEDHRHEPITQQESEDLKAVEYMRIAVDAVEYAHKYGHLNQTTFGPWNARESSITFMTRREAQTLFFLIVRGAVRVANGYEVCYANLGCFSKENKMSFTDGLPHPPEVVGTVFLLHTPGSTATPEDLPFLDLRTSFWENNFDIKRNLVVLIHGFGQSRSVEWYEEAKEALKMIGCNVIIVDWSKGAAFKNYARACANTALVGRQIAVMLMKLTIQHPTTVLPDLIHLVGFSLGAHVAGYAGRFFSANMSMKLGRITALDPAGPLFHRTDVRVHREDADFVDVIHTNRGTTSEGKFGLDEDVGHADFYPNGGTRQPGCTLLDVGCSHRRAPEFFIESIRAEGCNFTSYGCGGVTYEPFNKDTCPRDINNAGEMGYHSKDRTGRKQQLLTTSDHSPYCLRHKAE